MNLLLDTHTLVWWLSASPRLSKRARDTIHGNPGAVFVSAASLWELSAKYHAGRWPEVATMFPDPLQILAGGAISTLSISASHALEAGKLPIPPSGHRDPFDRMLVAQAAAEGLAIVTCDPKFAAYPVRIVW